MRLGARADDWHSGNPKVKPAVWVGLFLGAMLLYIIAAAAIGTLVNGNGSPFLS